MQNAFALLRYASRLWIFILRTTLITLGIACIAALLAFFNYTQTIAVVGHPASAQTIIGLREPVRVTFSHPMDEESVADSLRINPPTAVTLSWNPQSTEVTLVPRTQWKAESTYEIALSEATRSATLMPIDAWSMQFNTRAVLRVTQFLPAHLSTDVATDTLVVVRFSQQMVPQSAVNLALSAPLLQITPALSATQEWIDTQTLALASEAFLPNTRYTVVAPASLRDANGRPLEVPVTHTFTTRADQLNAITPADGATNVGINEPLIITVSGTVDIQELRTAVHITPATDVLYDLQPGTQDTSQLTIRPAQGWQYDSAYRVAFVNIGSQRISATTNFRTAPALALVAQSPPNGQPLQANRELRFVFNAPLDRSTVAGAIHFSPEPIRPAQIDVRGNDIRILGSWATQSAPVVRIDTTLRSTSGNPLPADILQTFAVDPRATQLTLPGALTDIVDTTQDGTLRISVAPHTTAVLTLTALSPATLARVRALTPPEFSAYDPTRYGIRPFVTIPITTELEPSFLIDVQSLLPDSISARVVLARVVDNKGAQDTRFVRILPHALYALTVGNAVVVGVPPEPQADPRRFEIYQNGVPIAVGTADGQGIWHTSAIKPQQSALIIDTTAPYDLVERTVRMADAKPLILAVLGAKDRIVTGESLPVTCARNQTTRAQTATVAFTSASGTVVSTRAILWNVGQRLTTATLEIPIDTQLGLAMVRCFTDTAQDAHPVLVTPTARTIVHIERSSTSVPQSTQIRLRDDAQRPVMDARLYWRDQSSFQTTRTDPNGIALIPDTVANEQLEIMTDHAHAVIEPKGEVSFWIDPPAQWYDADQPFELTARLSSSEALPTNTTVDLTVQDARDRIEVIRTLTPDSTGTVSTTLSLPRGTWFVVMRAGLRTARTTVHVGVLPDNIDIQAQNIPLQRLAITRWLTAAPQKSRLLIASQRDSGLQSTWADGPIDGILSTTGITDSTTFDYAYATPSSAFQSGLLRVVDPACNTASLTLNVDEQQHAQLQLNAPPESVVAIAGMNPDTGVTVWRTGLIVPDEGVLVVADTAFDDARFLDVRALITHPWCQRIIQERIGVQNLPVGTIDAPAAVSLGDVVPVRYRIRGLQPGTATTVQLDTTALLMTDPLPIYTQIADEQGNATFSWQMRVVREKPTLTISLSSMRLAVWQPTLVPPLRNSSPDGFVLTGRTTLEAGRFDTPFDLLLSIDDVAAALDADTDSTPTAAHLAHRIWQRHLRHDTTALQRLLFQEQRADGAWGYTPDAGADALTTATIVSALSQVEGMQRHIVPLIPQLQRAANNPALPLAVRAHVLYALSLQGVRQDEAMQALYALRETLGNEGLAAILLSVSVYPDIDIAQLRTTLTRRALPASRGMQWAVDPATATVHSHAAQNMLIVEALAYAQADPALLSAARSYLLSLRGTNGWGDAIANARAWHLRSFLFPELTNSQRVTVTDSSGHILSTSAIVSAQRIRGNASIWSDNPVLVGIDYPRDPLAPTHAVILRQQWYDEQGTRMTTPLRMRVGESVTGVCDIVVTSVLPYTRITLPIPALASLEVTILPSAFAIESAPTEYTFRILQSQPGVWRISYRLTAIRAGSAALPGMHVIDAAGTTHALQPTSTLYVRTP